MLMFHHHVTSPLIICLTSACAVFCCFLSLTVTTVIQSHMSLLVRCKAKVSLYYIKSNTAALFVLIYIVTKCAHKNVVRCLALLK